MNNSALGFIESAKGNSTLYRDKSPKERYFDQLIKRSQNNRSELGDINKRSDMIKQL